MNPRIQCDPTSWRFRWGNSKSIDYLVSDLLGHDPKSGWAIPKTSVQDDLIFTTSMFYTKSYLKMSILAESFPCM